MTAILLAAEAAEEGQVPAWVWGVGALAVLLTLLLLTLVFGKGRPHS